MHKIENKNVGNYTQLTHKYKINDDLDYTDTLDVDNEEYNDSKIFTTQSVIIASAITATVVGGLVWRAKRGKGAIPIETPYMYKVSSELKPTVQNQKEKIPNIITDWQNVSNLLSRLEHDDYDSTKKFKANLHIHSNKSDGHLHPLEILQQAVLHAEKLPKYEKFIFSLTDHDSIEGVQEIAKEISANPEKYKKIQFIPGIELSCSYHNPRLSKKPVSLDFLIYGFDVNSPEILQETKRRKQYLAEKTLQLFDDINKHYVGANFSVNKSLQEIEYKVGRNMCSNGYLKVIKNFIKKKLGKEFDEQFVLEKVRKHFGDANYAYEANLNLQSAIELAKKTKSFSSLAHPGRFNFQNSEVYGPHAELAKDIFRIFFKNGGLAIESHYMSYSPDKNWWNEVRSCLKSLNIYYERTGGYDTHGVDITRKS